MVCDICWPACAPGLEMSVTENGSGKTLSCHLHADVYRGKVSSAGLHIPACVYQVGHTTGLFKNEQI